MILDFGEKPQTKYDLLKTRRHFNAQFEGPARTEINPYPVGQYPVADHLRQRAHFPDVWNNNQFSVDHGANRALQEARLGARHILPNYQEPRESRVRPIIPTIRPNLGNFPHKKMHHFDHHLARTMNSCEFRVEAKHRSAPAGNPGQEWNIESAMSRKVDVPVDLRRNGISPHYPGDKTYGVVEQSDKFYSFGSTISHSVFGKISGGHGANYNVSSHGPILLGTDTRSDEYGRSFRRTGGPMALEPRAGQSKSYGAVVRDQARAEDIRSVAELPATDWGESVAAVDPPKKSGRGAAHHAKKK